MTPIDVIFFHEIGHYVARELNLEHYNGAGTLEILIHPCENNYLDYCGPVCPIVPPGININDPVPLSRLPEQLAAISYGCIFQAYYCGTDMNDCFKNKGQKDASRWNAALTAHGLNVYNRKFAETEREYFDELVKKECLREIFSLNPCEYLIKKSERNFQVHIIRLKNDITKFLSTHQQVYDQFIERYKYLINEMTLMTNRQQ